MADRSTRARFLMGLGLDGDGHTRVTKGEDYVLLGGTEETHNRMQEDVERFRHRLKKMGTDLQQASPREIVRAAREVRGGRRRRPPD